MDAVDTLAKKLDGTFLDATIDDAAPAAPIAPTMAMRPTMMMQPPTSAAAASNAGQQAPIAPLRPIGWWARLKVWLHDTFGGDDYDAPEQVPTAHHADVTFGEPAAMERNSYYRLWGAAPIIGSEEPLRAGEMGVAYDTKLRG